ncbi:MAG: glycosyltransferase family 39 protein [Phycisphaerales bacterium]|nr:glycosyltransferase family 39 protein [Phycisphaerales bacterium]
MRRRSVVRQAVTAGLPMFVALAIMLAHVGQGEFSVDTGWYSAIALQAWRGALDDGGWGALWSLLAEGGAGGIPYFNKPPLGFWLNGLALYALGPTVAGARMGSVVAGVLCCGVLAHASSLAGGRRVGLCAGLVLGLTWEFARHTHAFSLDAWLALFMLVGMWPGAMALWSGRGKWIALSGVGIGLALMTKPLLGLLLLPVLALWLVAVGRARWCGWLAGALAVALAIAAPWHVSMVALHGDAFTSQYFGREIAERAAGRISAPNTGGVGAAYYVLELLKVYWPWLGTIMLGAIALIARRASVSRRSDAAAGVLCIAFILVWVLALSLHPDRRARYLLPMYPAGAWLSALWLARWSPIGMRAVVSRLLPRIAVVAVIGAIVIAALPVRLHRRENRQWSAVFEHMHAAGITEVYQGGLAGARSGRVYLETGRWPTPTRDHSGALVARPAWGSYLLYHRRDGWSPGAGEEILFTSGDLTLTQFRRGAWSPEPLPDAGE